MTVDELKKKIGNAKFEEIMALVRKAKAEGKSTNEIAAMIRAMFTWEEFHEIEPEIVTLIQTGTPPPPPPPGKP